VNEKPRSWRPNSTLAKWLGGVLVGQAMLNIVCMFLHEGDRWTRVYDVLQTTDVSSSTFNTRVQDAMATANSQWFSIASYAISAALVLYIVWTWRSANNALALGRTGARQSPGWVIAGWLVPFLNLVLPYQTMSDLYRSSGPDAGRGDAWRSRHSSGRIATWWVAYLVGSFGYAFSILWVLLGHLSVSEANVWFAVTRGVLALSGLLGAWVVWDVTQRQEHQNAIDPAVTREQVQIGAGAPGAPAGYQQAGHQQGGYPQYAQQIVTGANGLPTPGWYVDPSGLHDFRYWDGVAWTEHVSRNGVAGLSPVAPTPPALPRVAPDWFPDPSGRHEWRYWGGDDWTPHVSDAGVHADDPLAGPAAPPDPDDVLPTGA
jgi:hypothetical protein